MLHQHEHEGRSPPQYLRGFRQGLDIENSLFRPTACLNNSHHGPGLDHVSIGDGDESLIGGLRVAKECTNPESQVELRPQALGNVLEHLFAKLGKFAARSLTMD